MLPFISCSGHFVLAGKGYDPTGNYPDYSAFMDWLRCYYNPEMRNLVDHDGRTMWFKVSSKVYSLLFLICFAFIL